MKTYRLKDADTLVFSVNSSQWAICVFEANDFKEIEAATAEEVATVINRSGTLAAYVDDQGDLVLATAVAGGHTTLEIDAEQSSAAGALGLGQGQTAAQGEGLRAARLVSLAAEPFALPFRAAMTIIIDDHRRKITFNEEITNGSAMAADVAKVINAKRKKVAEASRDGRVILTSITVGAGSKLEVEPGRADQNEADAAAVLGFIGAAAFDQPHVVAPARLVCGGQSTGLQVLNLTASPVELHFLTGTIVLSARASMALPPGEAANSQLQRLIEQGMVRLLSARGEAG